VYGLRGAAEDLLITNQQVLWLPAGQGGDPCRECSPQALGTTPSVPNKEDMEKRMERMLLKFIGGIQQSQG
jgi:hypothetical protein